MKEEKKPTVLIGVPSHDGFIHAKFYEEIDALVRYSLEHGVGVFTQGFLTFQVAIGSLLPMNRRNLAEAVFEIGADYLLTIDTDSADIPPDALVRLLAHKKEMVGAVVFTKSPPHVPCFGDRLKEDDKTITFSVGYEPDQLLKVDGIGFGFTLITNKLLKDCLERNPRHELFACSERVGEDWGFCQMTKVFGYDTYVDTGLVIGHRGSYIYGDWDASLYLEEIKELQLKGFSLLRVIAEVEAKYGNGFLRRKVNRAYGFDAKRFKQAQLDRKSQGQTPLGVGAEGAVDE